MWYVIGYKFTLIDSVMLNDIGTFYKFYLKKCNLSSHEIISLHLRHFELSHRYYVFTQSCRHCSLKHSFVSKNGILDQHVFISFGIFIFFDFV